MILPSVLKIQKTTRNTFGWFLFAVRQVLKKLTRPITRMAATITGST